MVVFASRAARVGVAEGRGAVFSAYVAGGLGNDAGAVGETARGSAAV